jgi:sulfate transport system permease protein
VATSIRFVRPSPLPGFTPAFGAALLWLGVIVLIPLGALVLRGTELGFAGVLAIASQPRVLAALELSFGLSFGAAFLNLFLGGVLAWVLTRYDFPGRRFIDAAVDLPFALPTAVAGIALTAIYAPNGWIGAPLNTYFGLKVAFTPLGIFVALTFIGLPFVVRTVQPVLAEAEVEIEEASATLGARRLQTILRVMLPPLIPAFLTGFALAFARAVGEYGSVIFIAGNVPFVSEIAPLMVVVRLEEFDYAGATAVAVIMLTISFFSLFAINALQAWSRRRLGHA